MNKNNYSSLQLANLLNNKARKVVRYVQNPHVTGDNIAEHLAFGYRYIIYLSPKLRREFSNSKDFIFRLLNSFLVHDNDEILQEEDISTFKQDHNADNMSVINRQKKLYSDYGIDCAKTNIDFFEAYKAKSDLIAKITKAIDAIIGTEFAVEQKIGMINPFYYIMCQNYLNQHLGVSKVIDEEIKKLNNRMDDMRENFITDRHYSDFLDEFLKAGFQNEKAVKSFVKKLLDYQPKESEVTSELAYTTVWEIEL
jgi:hypothetical protein